MALPEIKIRMSADTRGAEAGVRNVTSDLDRFSQSADTARRAAGRLDPAMDRIGNTSGRMRGAIQNASFQLADFAVMVQGGVDASRALAVQLPQLLAGFGVMGAAIGAVVAIAPGLNSLLASMGGEAGNLSAAFGTLAPLVDQLGAAFGAMRDVSVAAIELVVNNLDRILITGGVVAAFFGGQYVAAMVAAQVASMSFAGALAFVRAALIRLGVGAIIVALGELAYQFSRLVQASGGFGQALNLLGDVAAEVWSRINSGAAGMVESLKALWFDMEASFLGAISRMGTAASDMLFSLGSGLSKFPGMEGIGTGIMGASNDVLQGSVNLGASAGAASSAAGAARGRAADAFGAAGAPIESVQRISDLLHGIKDDRVTIPDLLGVGDEGEGAGGKGGSGGGKGGKLKILKEKLSAQEQAIRDHLERIKSLTQGTLTEKLSSWGGYFSSLVTMTGTNNKKLLTIGRSFAAAQALIDAWAAHNATLRDPTLPWWARIASAANVLAAGIGAVNAIKGVNPGGGGGGASGATGALGASATAGGAAASGRVDRFVTIDIRGNVLSKGDKAGLISALQEAFDDGYKVQMA